MPSRERHVLGLAWRAVENFNAGLIYLAKASASAALLALSVTALITLAALCSAFVTWALPALGLDGSLAFAMVILLALPPTVLAVLPAISQLRSETCPPTNESPAEIVGEPDLTTRGENGEAQSSEESP